MNKIQEKQLREIAEKTILITQNICELENIDFEFNEEKSILMNIVELLPKVKHKSNREEIENTIEVYLYLKTKISLGINWIQKYRRKEVITSCFY